MSFDWQLFLKVAEELRGQSADSLTEARQRTGISRAYYGVFCASCVHAEGKGAWRREGSGLDHQRIQKYMASSGTASGWKVGNFLGKLREARRKADYEDVVANSAKTLENALADAREALRLLPTS
jgi:hypothetical protein